MRSPPRRFAHIEVRGVVRVLARLVSSTILTTYPYSNPSVIMDSVESENSTEENVSRPVHDAGVVPVQVKANTTGHDAPPDGGLKAWLQVAGSFFLYFNTWYVHLTLQSKIEQQLMRSFGRGIINTFGVFQTYYATSSLSDESPSNISWIGSIQAFLLLLVGVVTGPLYDAGYFRALIVTGSFLVVCGLMMTSICTEYWQFVLAQGLCIGLGQGFITVPAIAILPQYFAKRKALAIGVAVCGSSFGGVIQPIVFRQLQPRIGFPWTTRVLGFIALATCLFSISVMRVRQIPKQKRSLVESAAFKEAPFSLFCIAMFFGYVGFFGPIFYISSYAIDTAGVDHNVAIYLLAIVNAASIPGRILPGFLALRVGSINMLLAAASTTGILVLCWIGIHNTEGMIAFSILYGFFSGGFVSLPAVAMTSLTPDLSRLGTRLGMCYAICSFGSLGGTPVAGAILTATGKYLGVQLFSGLTILLTGVLLLVTRLSKAGAKVRVKV